MQVGSLVVIKNDKQKCLYKVIEIYTKYEETICLLYGVYYRITREELMSNLIEADEKLVVEEENKEKKYYLNIIKHSERSPKQKYVLGKILHIDGDCEYLNKCLELYKELGIYAYGKCIPENRMSEDIGKYLLEIDPDIVVITGHDLYNNKGIKELDNYANTKNFMKVVKEIRKVKESSCVIIAGACQSNFEALIASGADFASSPKRINVHTYDPAIIAIKASTTSFTKIISSDDLYKYIENGRDAYSGLQTFGKMRLII